MSSPEAQVSFSVILSQLGTGFAIVHRSSDYCLMSSPEAQAILAKFGKVMENKGGGFAIVHRNSPLGLRLFIGAQIET
jgi:hypothetical protein